MQCWTDETWGNQPWNAVGQFEASLSAAKKGEAREGEEVGDGEVDEEKWAALKALAGSAR